ncbi:hypothetical protein BDW75DRAFT_239710 [Aspergillus navahoensis]
MHCSNVRFQLLNQHKRTHLTYTRELLHASAMTLAPAVYSYGVAIVNIAYSEACHNGEASHKNVDDSESTVVTKDTCTQMPTKYTFEIDAYSFSVPPVTNDTSSVCQAVGVYTNDEGTPCIGDEYFEKHASVKLFCVDEERHDDDGHEHGAEHGAEHGKDDHEDEGRRELRA